MHPLVLAAALAAAPSPTPAPSATPLKVIETIYTSDRRAEPIDQTSRPTFVITRVQIEARGARTVAGALRGVPGVTELAYGGFGSQPSVGIRGASMQQTLVLLDGTPIATGSNGEIDLGMLSTAGVSRIEVVEGGASTLYGTTAMGGVINVITAVPRGTYLSASTGSYGESDLRAALGDGRLGVAFDRHVAANDYPYPAFDGSPAGTRTNAGAQATSARLSYASPSRGAWRVRGSVSASALTNAVPGSLQYPTPYARQSTSFDEGHLELRRTSTRSVFSVALSGSRQALPYVDPSSGGESDTYDGRSQISVKEVLDGEHTTLIAGVDLARESDLVDLGPYAVPGTPAAFAAGAAQAAIYAQQSWSLRAGSRLFVGARAEHDSPHGAILAPEVGTVVPLGRLRVAANLGEAFRVPTLIDLYYPGYSNPNLQPEKSRNADLTVEAPAFLGGASIGWFGREASNLIALDQNFVPQNTQRASIHGLTATLATRPLDGMVATLGVTDLYRALDASPGAGDARLRFEPTVQATLGVERPFAGGNTAFGMRAQIVGPHVDYYTAADGSTPAIDGYSTVDAYVRMRLAGGAVLTLRARNLGNAAYAPIYGYPAPGRTYSLDIATR